MSKPCPGTTRAAAGVAGRCGLFQRRERQALRSRGNRALYREWSGAPPSAVGRAVSACAGVSRAGRWCRGDGASHDRRVHVVQAERLQEPKDLHVLPAPGTPRARLHQPAKRRERIGQLPPRERRRLVQRCELALEERQVVQRVKDGVFALVGPRRTPRVVPRPTSITPSAGRLQTQRRVSVCWGVLLDAFYFNFDKNKLVFVIIDNIMLYPCISKVGHPRTQLGEFTSFFCF